MGEAGALPLKALIGVQGFNVRLDYSDWLEVPEGEATGTTCRSV
jgi:hypothetical protein